MAISVPEQGRLRHPISYFRTELYATPAYRSDTPWCIRAARDRHLTYNAALIATGVTVLKGHHITAPNGKRLEKQSDVNLALSLMMDGEDNVYDIAYLLSGDSDQAATGRFFKERFGTAKKLIGVGTPSRPVAEKLTTYTHSNFEMTKDHLDQAVFPAFVPGRTGNLIRRPDAYEPPSWWVHPDDRP